MRTLRDILVLVLGFYLPAWALNDELTEMGFRYLDEDSGYVIVEREPDFDLHLEVGRRGAWLEYDAIGNQDFVADEAYIHNIQKLLAAGLGAQLLLSHDRGWYDPAQPGGGQPLPYTYLSDHFLPKLRRAGIAEEMIRQLTHINPFNAYAR